jgi:adenylate kinase
VRLVLLGPPGAGKGTQARLLEGKLHVPQIASGDLLRTAVRDQTTLGMQAKSFMDKGGLVPDELVLGMIAERLDRPDAQRGFILDGFPRNVAQAEVLGSILKRRNEALDKVVAITLPEDEIVKRISGRRTCRSCGSMYHVVLEPPRNDNTCDKCGAELYQREDDAEHTVRARLRVYATETRPLLDYYGRCGLLARVDGLARPEQIEHRILCAMGVN